MSKHPSRDKPDAGAPPERGRSGRFGEPMSARMQRFNASVDFDRRLAAVDIAGSLAHARMLAATGILSADDLASIERGLQAAEIDHLEVFSKHLVVEAPLWQPPMQRGLATFKAVERDAAPRGLTLAAARRGLALA